MVDIIDLAPETEDFRQALVEGLADDPKEVPCKFLYDEHGSRLFEQICELEEYYPTRTEIGIMRDHVGEMADAVGSKAALVELGSGSGIKTRLLLEALDQPASYLPIEISKAALRHCAETIAEQFPDLDIHPVCADYTEPIELPALAEGTENTVAYFPGSTIGNFRPDDATEFLGRIADLVGAGGGLLIGVDLYKDPEIIKPAYNDAAGVTAEFTSNLFTRANREADANFDPETFEHDAPFDPERSCIEMGQVSQIDQTVEVDGQDVEFEEGEKIVMEHSFKHTPERFRGMADEAGFEVGQVWTDDEDLFSIWYLEVPE
jgi:dimethylhistidine N-methyltransferase